MELGENIPRKRRPLLRPLGQAILRLLGWRLELDLPNVPKMMLLGAPHTSNWDALYAIATICAVELRIAVFAKHTLFYWPWGSFFRWVGLLPIDRRATNGMVGQTTQAFESNPQLVVCIAPEGTRKRVEKWKSGFWQIAKSAQVPIVCVYLDYKRKVCGSGLTLMPSDSFEADLARIQAFYRTITPHTPANFATPA